MTENTKIQPFPLDLQKQNENTDRTDINFRKIQNKKKRVQSDFPSNKNWL